MYPKGGKEMSLLGILICSSEIMLFLANNKALKRNTFEILYMESSRGTTLFILIQDFKRKYDKIKNLGVKKN